MKINELVDFILKKFDLSSQEGWDNSGVQILSGDDDARGILVSLDVSVSVIDEAEKNGCNLIVSHHPLFFRDIKKIDDSTSTGVIAAKAIRRGISIISIHTPADKIYAAKLAERLTGHVFFSSAIAGGEFAVTTVEPTRLSDLAASVAARSSHHANFSGNQDNIVKNIAFINGSGASFCSKIFANSEIDCVITGDVTYHVAAEAVASGKAIIDAGHFPTEIAIRELIALDIMDCLTGNGIIGLKVLCSSVEKSPIKAVSAEGKCF